MFRWYVINTYSGHEKKVKANLEHRLHSMSQRDDIKIVVPTEQVVETKDGQKVQPKSARCPGTSSSTWNSRTPGGSSRTLPA